MASGRVVPRVGFIVTNPSGPAERVVAFYNQRGTAEQHIKEGKNAIKWTRLSCRSFRNNAVRLQLHALAYNLGNFMRTLALPDAVEQWSLTTPREKLVKIGTPRSLRHLSDGRGRHPERPVRRDLMPHRSAQTESRPDMTDGILLMRADDRMGVSGKRPKGQFCPPAPPIGPSSHGIRTMMPCNSPATCLADGFESRSSRWKALHGESQLRG